MRFKQFVESVIDFGAAKKKKASAEFHAKVKKAFATIPDHLVRQDDIEKEVGDKLKSIRSENRLKFALPHIQKKYSKETHSIEALHHSLPLYNHGGSVAYSDEDTDETAIAHSKRHKHEIIKHIDDKLEKFEKLRETAKKAPASQYPNGQINYAINHWNRIKENFSRIKE